MEVTVKVAYNLVYRYFTLILNKNELIPNLFRTEYSKMVAVLCKVFGMSNIQEVEDLVSETFLTASETWSLKGVPKNPKAWLYAVAKNKAKDLFKRNQLFQNKIRSEVVETDRFQEDFEFDLSENNIQDSQLKMIFAICNPIISVEMQISMALKILCSFGVEEIANAFLTNKSTINKRLYRAKEKLRVHKVDFNLPIEKELNERLSNVLLVLYLLFNEGYFSSSTKQKIRKEMCFEAMRLLYLLLGFKETNFPEANALMALFCFQASRFEARTNTDGEQILYNEQDATKWDFELIKKGENFLMYSGNGNQFSKYQLEAFIAFWHTKPKDSKEKWESILQLYNQLIQIEYSPITALNRTYALAKARSKQEALKEALKINLENNYMYFSLLAELYKDSDVIKEKENLQKALSIAKNENDKKLLLKKLELIKE